MCFWLECMHIQLMEIILESLWLFLFVAVSCLFCECPQKELKMKIKLIWNNQPWTCTFSIFSKEAWIPCIYFTSTCSSSPKRLVADWDTLFLHLLILLLSRFFFDFWTVSYPAHWNQTFTIQDHISGREMLFLHHCLVLISTNRP